MITIAQIGCGYWGPNLLRNLTEHPQCQVKYVADLSVNRRTFVNNLYPDIITTNSTDKIFSDNDVNAVVIATPAKSHYDLAIQSLKAGKHILVEKPMACTVKEIDHIQALSTKENLTAMVGHTFLFNPAVEYLKHAIENGELGDLRYIISQRLNLGRIRSDVDALWNFAPHDISIIQYLLNNLEPDIVSAQGMDYIQPGINDVSFLNLVYPNKIMANIHVSWLDPRKVRKIVLVGSKKMIIYDDLADDKITIHDKGIDKMAKLGENMDFDNSTPPQFNLRSGKEVIPKIINAEPLQNEINHFIDCITNKISCRTDSVHAKSVINILERSSSTSKEEREKLRERSIC